MGYFYIILIIVLVIMVLRFVGAWMMRITDILDNQCIIIDRLNELIRKLDNLQIEIQEKEDEIS